MSAIKKECIIIDVTKGDCVEANRKNGKSNTGTYFVSSIKEFDLFKDFFICEKKYSLNLNKIFKYKILFNELFRNELHLYKGKGEKFDSYCNYLLSLENDPIVEITLRINDSRVFMRFKDNTNPIINAFRNMLYEDLSFICIEKNDNGYDVFPVTKFKDKSNHSIDESDGLDIDE